MARRGEAVLLVPGWLVKMLVPLALTGFATLAVGAWRAQQSTQDTVESTVQRVDELSYRQALGDSLAAVQYRRLDRRFDTIEADIKTLLQRRSR